MSVNLEQDVLNILDKYKEHYTDNDYKNLCDILMKSYIEKTQKDDDVDDVEELDDTDDDNDVEEPISLCENKKIFNNFMRYNADNDTDIDDIDDILYEYIDAQVSIYSISYLKKLVKFNGGYLNVLKTISNTHGDLEIINIKDNLELALKQVVFHILVNYIHEELHKLNPL
jgi:hypothetical protein